MRSRAWGAAALAFAALFSGSGFAAEKVKFTVQSPQWGQVYFSFDGTKACAVNNGQQMCGTASKLPKPGESFTMKWDWPQKAWKRPAK